MVERLAELEHNESAACSKTLNLCMPSEHVHVLCTDKEYIAEALQLPGTVVIPQQGNSPLLHNCHQAACASRSSD